ncbi:cupin domain-containing protein [Achromobacter spanius]|uniref:(R)-mandelonitrile lyase n=1 Tax=Achromobacter spanius TaxID=217203 RepID=UPI003207C6E8
MKVVRNGEGRTNRGSAEYFSGTVLSEPIVVAPDPARLNASRVTFLPAARTAWHSHPYGQTLYVTAGTGLVQLMGEPARVIRPGDCVWIAPGEKHWHGATALHAMTHIAMHERLDGQYATWMEQVSEDDYAAAQRLID